MMFRNLILTTCFLVMNSGNIDAASFDCGKAASEVEKIICSDDGLSKLDEELTEAYRQALKRIDIRKQTIESQRHWLKYERNVCPNAECIKKAYETRIKELGYSSPSTSTDDYRWDQSLDPASAPAGDPQLIPVDPKICKCYEENLRYFARRNTPMSCERPIAPHLKYRIKKVEWEDLDPGRYPDLFRAIITYHAYLPGTGEDVIQEDLKHIRSEIAKTVWVFRRAKLSLVGRIQPHASAADTEPYWIVQYGPNDISLSNPCEPWRCKPQRGDGIQSNLQLYIVSAAKHELTKELFSSTNSTEGQHLRLIDNRLFVENIRPGGWIALNEVDTGQAWGQTVCDFKFKKAK